MPAGTPIGGQWAPSSHEEPEVALDPAATLTKVRQSARRESWRFSLDADEVAGDALAKIYAARGKLPTIRNPDAYISKVVHNAALTTLATRRAGAALSGQETKAYREYWLTCSQMEQRMSRHLTTYEEDAVANKLREQYNRRIGKNFHRRLAPVLGVPVKESADNYMYHERRTFAPGSLADRVERIADNDVRQHNIAAQLEARALVWDALAEGYAAPPVARASLAHQVVTDLRKQVSQAGGAMQVADGYAAGVVDDETACALFAPFGEIDEEGRQGVVDMLRRYHDYADELWDAAAAAATVPR